LILVDYYQLLIPEYLGVIVDGVKDGNTLNFTSIIIDVVIVGVVLCLGRIVWRLTLITTAKKIEANIRKEMFEKSERLSQKFYHENKVGTVMAWFTNDLETI
jgi:ATP-binding cassette subfamily B protein